MSNKINVSFPNDGPITLDFELIVKWDITEQKEIGDTVFFWTGGIYCSADKKDYDKIIEAKK